MYSKRSVSFGKNYFKYLRRKLIVLVVKCLRMPSKNQLVRFCVIFCVFGVNVGVLAQGASAFSRSQSNASSMNGMSSPCPNIFQYEWDGIEWHGIIIAPSLPYGTPARLVARLSIGRVLPTKYAGSLELIGPRAEVLHAMLNEQPIRYKVYFPLAHPLPVVTTITLNNRLICSGPTVSGPIVTSITLEHTLYPHGQTLNSRNIIRPMQAGQFVPESMMINNNNQYPDLMSELNDDDDTSNPNEKEIEFNVKPNLSLNLNRNNKPFFNLVEKNILTDLCGTSASASITPLIANGEVTRRGSHPWLIALFTQKSLGLEFTCAGTLISNRYVLTAAHCIRYGENPQLSPDEIIIVLGKYHIRKWTEPGSVLREASKITPHPEYHALSGDADLAAIELSEPVQFTDKIRPICLDTTNEEQSTTEGIIVGWGRDEIGLKITAEPRQVKIRIVTQEDCLRSSIEFRYITSNRTLCAEGVTPDSGPCSGDSGGGLFVKGRRDGKMFLRGITSMSLADSVTKSCDLKHYSVYVDVSKFMVWIRQFLV